MVVEWAGYRWDVRELPPVAAGAISRLGSNDSAARLGACTDIVKAAGVNINDVLLLLFASESEVDILDFVSQILTVGSGRPWKTTVSLCMATVSQWGMIRGRLIEKGIADPLRQLPSLTALLDVVEVMILDSAEGEKKREETLRDLYRRDDMTAPPVGWTEGVEGFDGF